MVTPRIPIAIPATRKVKTKRSTSPIPGVVKNSNLAKNVNTKRPTKAPPMNISLCAKLIISMMPYTSV